MPFDLGHGKIEWRTHAGGKCESWEHGNDAVSAITKRGVNDRALVNYLHALCPNVGRVPCEFMGTTLHAAAAVGRAQLAQWLMTIGRANVNKRDTQSSWTPLHRSLFHGNIDVAVRLIQCGADLFAEDREKLTPLDLLSFDLNSITKDRIGGFNYLYVWGSNSNYTIGTGNDSERKQPEILPHFAKNSIEITLMRMNELHSVFVGSCGGVWACGHGTGGRLGTGTEMSYLAPTQIRLVDKCIDADAGLNHTLVLLKNGAVLGTGSNEHHQLGLGKKHESTLSFRNIPLNQEKVVHIHAGKYHSVFCTRTALITCGLNGGQLGHPDNEPYIIKPTLATRIPSVAISLAATSLGATVFASNGNVFLLTQYECRKIGVKLEGIEKIVVVGGTLKTKIINESEPIKIFILIHGRVLLWEESEPNFTWCLAAKRSFKVWDMDFALNKLYILTEKGDAHQGNIVGLQKAKEKPIGKNPPLKFYLVNFSRISNIHRGRFIRVDPKGHNFAVGQVLYRPNVITSQSSREIPGQLNAFLQETSEEDSLQDVVFETNGVRFPAHRYIVSSRSPFFASLVKDKAHIKLDVSPLIFKEILSFLYSGGYNPEFGRDLVEAATRFELTELVDELKGKKTASPVKFDRNAFPELRDVVIRSESGSTLEAHKCLLAARLHYFHSMFLCGWAETSKKTVIKFPFPENILRDILEFLYTEEPPKNIVDDVDYALRVLMAADHLIFTRLKELCEDSLSPSITVKNSMTLLYAANSYNAPRLKTCVLEFMALNIHFLLEAKTLQALDNATLKQITETYYKFNFSLNSRTITPYSDAPLDEDVLAAPPTTWPEDFSEVEVPEEVEKKPKKKESGPKKKPQKKSEEMPIVKKEAPIVVPELPPEIIPTPPITPERVEKVFNTGDFPGLNESFPKRSTPLKIKYEGRRVPVPRKSQKERKKSMNEDDDPSPLKISSPQSPKFRGWGPIPSPDFPPLGESPKMHTMEEIIADAREEKENLVRMKAKPFSLTQMEDKAIEDLMEFYNAHNIFDERIRVERVLPSNIAQPTWFKSKH